MPSSVMLADPKQFRKLSSRAVEIARSIEVGYVELGEVLFKIIKHFAACGSPADAKRVLGYATFNEWVDNELRFKRSKAYMISNVYERLVEEAGATPEQLRVIGWRKAHQLSTGVRSGVVTKQNVGEWVGKAQSASRDALAGELDSGRKRLHEERPELAEREKEEAMKRVTFVMREGEAANLELAIEAVKKFTGADDGVRVGWCVDKIALEFNSTYPNFMKGDQVLAGMCARLEQMFGVTMLAHHPLRGWVYGSKHLQDKAAEEAQP